MVLFFFIPKNILYFRTEQNILYFRTEQNAHVKWGVGVVGIVFTIVLFYDHLIEIVS